MTREVGAGVKAACAFLRNTALLSPFTSNIFTSNMKNPFSGNIFSSNMKNRVVNFIAKNL